MVRRISSNKNQSVKDWFFSTIVPFIARYGIFIVVFLVALPRLIKYIKDLQTQAKVSNEKNAVLVNNAENGTASPKTIVKKSEDVQKTYPNLKPVDLERFKTVAQSVAMALGTNVQDNHYIFNTDMYNVSAWSENESEVIRLLKTVPTTFSIVADLYYNVYTRSRDLKADLLKYLNKSELDKIRVVQKKYGKVFI